MLSPFFVVALSVDKLLCYIASFKSEAIVSTFACVESLLCVPHGFAIVCSRCLFNVHTFSLFGHSSIFNSKPCFPSLNYLYF